MLTFPGYSYRHPEFHPPTTSRQSGKTQKPDPPVGGKALLHQERPTVPHWPLEPCVPSGAGWPHLSEEDDRPLCHPQRIASLGSPEQRLSIGPALVGGVFGELEWDVYVWRRRTSHTISHSNF